MRGPTLFLLFWLSFAGACNRFPIEPLAPTAEHYVSDPNSVGFEIESIQSEGHSSQWLATYSAGGRTAKFKIEIGHGQEPNDKESKDLGIKTGEGKFSSVPGSDASVLLVDLQRALEAKKLPGRVKRVAELPFAFVSFGEHESQASHGGGFNDSPPGNWISMKIFIGQGDTEGDVFLNLNPVIKKGQFSMKDPDYGDNVLMQLAKVL